MSIFDLIILIPLVIGAYKGFKDGLILELFSIFALILAIIGGFKLLHVVMEYLRDSWDIDGSWLPIIAFLIIFIGIVLLTNVAGKALSGAVNVTFLGVFDKLGGALLALFKWAFGISVVLWILNRFNMSIPQEWIDDSFIYPYLEPMAAYMWEVIAAIFPVATDFFRSIQDYTME